MVETSVGKVEYKTFRDVKDKVEEIIDGYVNRQFS